MERPLPNKAPDFTYDILLNKSNESASFKSPDQVSNIKASSSSSSKSSLFIDKNQSVQPLKESNIDKKPNIKKKEKIVIDETRCYNCKTPYDTKLTNAKHRKVTDSCNHSICFSCLMKEMPCLLCEHLKEQEIEDKLISNSKIIPDTQPALKVIQDTQPVKKIIQNSDWYV